MNNKNWQKLSSLFQETLGLELFEADHDPNVSVLWMGNTVLAAFEDITDILPNTIKLNLRASLTPNNTVAIISIIARHYTLSLSTHFEIDKNKQVITGDEALKRAFGYVPESVIDQLSSVSKAVSELN